MYRTKSVAEFPIENEIGNGIKTLNNLENYQTNVISNSLIKPIPGKATPNIIKKRTLSSLEPEDSDMNKKLKISGKSSNFMPLTK